MLNNYDATLQALATFLIENMPPGAERERDRLVYSLGKGEAPEYLHFEFKPTQDVGCTLYVRVESPEGRYGHARIMDEAGNRWYAYAVKCDVSWSSWGSADLVTSQRRLACMTEVTRFACEVERAFSGVFHRLDATAEQIKAEEAKYAKARVVEEVKRLVLANSKGMKVGQTKSAVLDVKYDLRGTGIHEILVEKKEAGRTFKYNASPCQNSGIGASGGIVWFMRLDS